MPDAYVLFATGRDKRCGTWRNQQVSRLIRILTRSDLCHCAIAYDGAVLDPTLSGVRYYAFERAVRCYPGLYGLFRVPLIYAIDLDYFQRLTAVPQPLFPRLWRTLDFGRGEWVYDCLCVVLACLQAGGIPVPHNLLTPRTLYRWLIRKGYDHARTRYGETTAERYGKIDRLSGRTPHAH